MDHPNARTPDLLAGRCLCGAVEYRVADEFPYAANCHCSDCRRATGAAFESFAGIERGKLQLRRGGDSLLVGSKAPWFTITDDLPQYEGHVDV